MGTRNSIISGIKGDLLTSIRRGKKRRKQDKLGRIRRRKKVPVRIPHGKLSAQELVKAQRLNNFRMTKDVMDDDEVVARLSLAQRNGIKAIMDVSIASIELEVVSGPPSGMGAQISYNRADPSATLVYEIRKSADLIDLNFINQELIDIDAELALLDPITPQEILDELQVRFAAGDTPGELFELLNDRLGEREAIQSEITNLTNKKSDLETLRDTVLAGL